MRWDKIGIGSDSSTYIRAFRARSRNPNRDILDFRCPLKLLRRVSLELRNLGAGTREGSEHAPHWLTPTGLGFRPQLNPKY